MLLTALYVPATRPERWAKAAHSGADAVIIDLEDAVPPDQKEMARRNLARHLHDVEGVNVQVRINAAGTPWHEDDVAAVAQLSPDVHVRIPKAESVAAVGRVAATLGERELHLLVESALGVELAFELARAACVASVGLGEADLRSELGGEAEATLGWMRSRVVTASIAAGLGRPLGPMYPVVRDLEGLMASTKALGTYGFLGRTVIHPAHVAVVRSAFRPSAADFERAQLVLESAVEETGGVTLPDGSFIDRAMLGQYRQIVELGELVGVAKD